jgi:hypothetical protein
MIPVRKLRLLAAKSTTDALGCHSDLVRIDSESPRDLRVRRVEKEVKIQE